MIIALLAASLAQDVEPPQDTSWTLRMDSGMRPLGLPIGALIGGGIRVGKPLGIVTPFAGGSAAWASGGNGIEQGQDDKEQVGAALYTASLGARLVMAALPAAQTFLVAGRMFTHGAG
ncbi:MAG: hypothetical protein GWP91_04580 [Rhodobacterales bacterium]|nr:hypothetical protein [Rhodobacterales bacterium]